MRNWLDDDGPRPDGIASPPSASAGGPAERGGELGERNYGGNRVEREGGLGRRMVEGLRAVLRGKASKR